jgi:hypothetical protein
MTNANFQNLAIRKGRLSRMQGAVLAALPDDGGSELYATVLDKVAKTYGGLYKARSFEEIRGSLERASPGNPMNNQALMFIVPAEYERAGKPTPSFRACFSRSVRNLQAKGFIRLWRRRVLADDDNEEGWRRPPSAWPWMTFILIAKVSNNGGSGNR